MAYKITSEYLDCDKSLGDSITEKELLEMGANIDALISAGHIKDETTTKSAPSALEGESNG
jgi:hypothetical protein